MPLSLTSKKKKKKNTHATLIDKAVQYVSSLLIYW